MSLHTLGWTDNSGPELFTVGWIEGVTAPAVEFPPGGGSSKKRYGPSARQIQQQQQQIEEENALMLSVIKAFLKMVD